VTICTQNRELSLQNEEVGRMVTNVWRQLENKYPQIRLDEFVVMSNHIHGIIVIDVVVGADLRVCPNDVGGMGKGEHAGSPQQDSPQPRLGSMIRWFKTVTTNYYIRGIRDNGWTLFLGRFWQRNYYERIIRNENEMNRIREYITKNPARWDWDQNNPSRIEKGTGRETTS
jgi:putative transposase